MKNSFDKRFGVIFGIATCLFATVSFADNSTCGALITQNQYTEVLKGAPSCFKNGCQGSDLTSMST